MVVLKDLDHVTLLFSHRCLLVSRARARPERTQPPLPRSAGSRTADPRRGKVASVHRMGATEADRSTRGPTTGHRPKVLRSAAGAEATCVLSSRKGQSRACRTC